FVSTRALSGLHRSAPAWSGSFSSRQRRTGLVEKSSSRNGFARVRPETLQPIPGSTSESSDQSRAPHAERFSRNWKLDGRRNSLARKSFAVEENSKINCPRTRHDFSRHEMGCAQIARNPRQRFFRS